MNALRRRRKGPLLTASLHGKRSGVVRTSTHPDGRVEAAIPSKIGTPSHSVSQASAELRPQNHRDDEGPDRRLRRSGPIHRWWAILGLNQ